MGGLFRVLVIGADRCAEWVYKTEEEAREQFSLALRVAAGQQSTFTVTLYDYDGETVIRRAEITSY